MELRLSSNPRKWQISAIQRWTHSMRGVISAVTGSGKTVFAHMCALKMLQRYPEGRIIIVVPTLSLLDQWVVSLREELNVHPDDITSFGSGRHHHRLGRFAVIVLNTARRIAPRLSQLAPTLLIVDECHRTGSPQNRKALRGNHVATLGLSATPRRDYDTWFDDFVAPTLGPILYEYSYEDARSDGVVTPFELINVRVSLLTTEERSIRSYNRRIAIASRDPREDVEDSDSMVRLLQRRAAVIASARMRIPVAAKLALAHRGSSTIIFHERIGAANEIVNLLVERGVTAVPYHTGISEPIRQENLRLFRRGVFECLVTCRALDEGLNVPETSVAVIASSTASVRQRIQRFGRVLRPSYRKKHSTIYTIYATDLEEARLKQEAAKLNNVASIKWLTGELRSHVGTNRK